MSNTGQSEEYKPVPVEAARAVAEAYEKHIVVILAYDYKHKLIHRTSYGTTDNARIAGARWADVLAARAGADLQESVCYQDFRLTRIKHLEGALQTLIERAIAQGINGTDIDEAYAALKKES